MTSLTIVKTCMVFPIRPIKVTEKLIEALDFTSVLYSYRTDDKIRSERIIDEEFKEGYIDTLYIANLRPHVDIEETFRSTIMFLEEEYNFNFHCYRSDIEKGFLTSEGKFVNRIEAYKIAKAANQLYREERSEQLYSDNVKF